ncbi:MAG: hypothetical protein ACRC1L_12790, partial [Prochlorococcaceae cyanobacterium]
AFVALAAEAQTYLQLDEGNKAARTIRQGLEELRPGLTQLMNAVLDCSCHYLKPEFKGEVDLDLVLWLHNGFRRMQRNPGEATMELTASQLFDRLRTKIGPVFSNHQDWHGEIPQVIVDTSDVPDAWIGPLNQGTDKAARWRQVQLQPGNYGTMVSGTTGNGSVFFNILPPGRTGAAIHVGHMGNDKDAGKTVGFNPDLSLQ